MRPVQLHHGSQCVELGIAELGSMTSKSSGLIMMPVAGGAVIPYLIAVAADHVGIGMH